MLHNAINSHDGLKLFSAECRSSANKISKIDIYQMMYRNNLWDCELFSMSLPAEYIFQIDVQTDDDL